MTPFAQVVMVTHSVDELLQTASSKFNITATKLFTPQGGEIDDVKLLNNDDILYVSCGENFIRKQEHKHSSGSDWITLNVGGECGTYLIGTSV